LRRSPGGVLDAESEFLVVQDLKLHTTHPEVHVGDQPIELTTVEHHLLHYLMMHSGHPVSVDQLLEDVWEYPSGTGDPTLVYVHIKKLRAKIESEAEPQYIRSVYGRGYIIDS
jgi:two-component system OmpR family response regulator